MHFNVQYYEIKKSKFYSYAFEVHSKEEIKELEDKLRKEYKKATHICSAYSFLENGIENSGFDDDGEPSGTAGRPIKELIKKRNINNIAIFVVRFFGRIKLGGGGLIRAYTKSASLAIDEFLKSKSDN